MPELSAPMYADEPCRHGIDVLTCSICLGRPSPGQEPEVAERGFPARFDSQCPTCHKAIHKGEPIVATSRSRYLHPECL